MERAERRRRGAGRRPGAAVLAGGLVVAGALLGVALVVLDVGDFGDDRAREAVPAAVEAISPGPDPARPVAPSVGDVAASPSLGVPQAMAPVAERLEAPARPGPPSFEAFTVVAVDLNDQPVAGARVRLWEGLGERDRSALAAASWEAARDVGLTDGDGRLEIRADPGAAAVRVEHETAGSMLGLPATDEGPRPEVLVRLLPRGHLRGVVLQVDGRPAPWAEVLLRYRDQESLAGFFEPLGAADPDGWRLSCDGEGRFDLTHDVWQDLFVTASWGELHSRDQVVGAAPGVAHALEILLPGPWSISGLVVDAEGEPEPEAPVTLWLLLPGGDPARGVLPQGEPFRVTDTADEAGRFRFDLPRAGSYALQARGSDDDVPGRIVHTAVDDGVPRAEVLLDVPRAARISGRLVDGAGLPLADVTVHARPAHLYEPARFVYGPTVWARWGEARADTDEDGRFVLQPLHPEGRYILFCRPDPALRERKLVVKDVPAGSEDLLLVASEEALRRVVLEGRVLASPGGRPVDELWPTLLIRLDGRVIDTEQPPHRGVDGQLRIQGLAPGYEYVLRVDAPGRGAVEGDWFVARGPVVVQDVSLPPPAELVLALTDRFGRPVAGAEVDLLLDTVFPVAAARRRELSDELGRVLLDDLDPGSWVITARIGSVAVSTEATLVGGQRRELELSTGE